ncbi:MAG: DUF2461 domain-containing protein [Chloroflexi bacterium]|nr:DUF2461 domain-containing protein [Chloroflexota bacterium]
MPIVANTFAGFRSEAIQFLADLAANNERTWFQPRRADYERLLKEPLEALCSALAVEFEVRGIPLRADPARSPFRIYRDVRFSKDKSPYKTNVGASFPWAGDGDGSVGGYFHLAPGEVFVGGGMWHPEPARLKAFRRLVDTDPARVHSVTEDPAFIDAFGHVSGDTLRRVPQGYAADHPDAALLKLKGVVFMRQLSDLDAAAPELPGRLADTIAVGLPLLRLLASLPA